MSALQNGTVKERHYSVYIMASRSHNLYIGVTNDLGRRVREHKERTIEGFTARYHVDRLVWYESYHYIRNAIAREKQLKGWLRDKKMRLIEEMNPHMAGLVRGMGKADPVTRAGPQILRRRRAKAARLRSG